MPVVRPALILASAALAASSLAVAVETPVKETVHLVVTGGSNAGRYDATGTRGGCSAGLSGPGSWGNQLSQSGDKDPKHLGSLQLVVPDAKAAAAGTKEFLLTVGFGPLLQRSAEYKVDTRQETKAASGRGIVTVKDLQSTARVTFSATTADGVTLAGTIDCKSVTRARE